MILILFVLHSVAFAQFPIFQSNISEKEASRSLVFKEFSKDYSGIMSFSQHSFLSGREEYFLLVFDNGKWGLVRWTFSLSSNSRPRGQEKELVHYDKDELNHFLEFLGESKFYSLNQDSINIDRKPFNDGESKEVLAILDGTTDRIEIFSNGKHLFLESHEPERFQKFIYSQQREVFIETKRRIFKLFGIVE